MTEKELYEATLADYDGNFKRYFDKIFEEYRREDNKMWLAGPSSYVFSLSGVKFAVDLIVRRGGDLNIVADSLQDYLSDISFILITHQHDDHFSLPLMKLIKDMPIRWYMPEGISRDLVLRSELKEENITYVKAGDVITVGDVSITVFDSPHLTAEETLSGEKFAEVGYLITTQNARILMPADVRNYAYDGYPKFSDIDLCISHVWAGGNALSEELYMPRLREFISFTAKFRAKRYFLTHLYEIGRCERYMWHDGHADIVKDRLKDILPTASVEVPRLGEGYSIC